MKSTKRYSFLDHYKKAFTNSPHNHPRGWSWWKRKGRKDRRKKLKSELNKGEG